MAAGLYTFTIEQGATYTSEIQWKNAANTAVDLSGYTAKMQLRDSQDVSSSLYLTLNTSASAASTGICLSGSAGNLNVNEGKLSKKNILLIGKNTSINIKKLQKIIKK